MDVYGLRVKIGLDPNTGHASYPRFNKLPCVRKTPLDWSRWVDTYGSGWCYDCCGHKEDTPESPWGQQWGMLLVPKEFVEQAVQMFPETCEAMSARDCEKFYDEKVGIRHEDEEIDPNILTGIKVKQDLGMPLTAAQKDAIDPNTPARGIRQNRRKRLKTFVEDRGFNVKDPD